MAGETAEMLAEGVAAPNSTSMAAADEIADVYLAEMALSVRTFIYAAGAVRESADTGISLTTSRRQRGFL